MKKLVVILVLLSGCSAGKIDLDKAVIAHSEAIIAMTEYVAALQEIGALPTAQEAKARLEEKKKKEKADEIAGKK